MKEVREGLVINGRYKLEEYKGGGSFGEVWKATDMNTVKEVAVKLYISLNKQGCDEFLEEYRIASGLVHKNLLVTESYDVWESRPYLTMKYCSNGSAAHLVGKLYPSPKDERLIWMFIRDVASGLAYLHNLQPDPIVHQDIKPDNVLIDEDDTFLITDFGISKRVRNTMRSQSTRAQKAGATAYMAPERFSSHPNPILASDIWSLGVSIYELAEGELPFSGMGGIMLKNGAEMPDLTGWSDDLNNIMHRCLETLPWERAKAYEIEKIAQDKVSYYNHLNNNSGTSNYNPRATQRQTTPPSSSVKGTVKKENNENIPTPPPTSSSWKYVIGGIFAICLFFIIFKFNSERPEVTEAKSHSEEYIELADRCSEELASGNGGKYQTLLSAKKKYLKMLKFEKQYSQWLPDVYNRAWELSATLDAKLSDAANEWANVARMQADDLGDYMKAIEYYKVAVSLHNDKTIAQAYERIKQITGYIYISDCKFANEKEDGSIIDGYGSILYSRKLQYLCPKIYYDCLSKDKYGYKDFYIKIIEPDGSLKVGTGSPAGYSYKQQAWISSGQGHETELGGWGNSTPHYKKGKYTCEIWYKKKKIYSKIVEVK